MPPSRSRPGPESLLRASAAGALLGALAGAFAAGVRVTREDYVANGLGWLTLDVAVADVARLLALGAALGAGSALAARFRGPGKAARARAFGVTAAGVLAAGAWFARGDVPWLRTLAETRLAVLGAVAVALLAVAVASALLLPLLARLPARVLAGGVGGVLLALAAGAIAPLLRAPPTGPNLLLLSIDTLRADRLGAYGYALAETPNLDALAEGGTLYETVIASAPVTLPSMATLMTGLDPDGHGARYNGFYRVRPAPVTLAEWLAERGYRTGAAVGNFALDSSFGIAQGFASFDDVMTEPMEPDGPGRRLRDDASWWTRFRATEPAQRPASEVTDAGLAWLARHGSAPFFLWLHYIDPHLPYRPPAGHRQGLHPYDGEISYVDAEIGRLLTEYRARLPGQQTLVVVVADHGESLGEHGIQGHVFGLYEQAVRIPLILNLPGRVAAGERVAAPLRARDVPLEILQAMGLTEGAPLRAQAQRAVLGGADWLAYSETWQPYIDRGEAPLRAVRSARFKYIRREGGEELYDLEADPAEQRNLLGEAAETAKAMGAWLERAGGDAGEAKPVTDEATEERLRALGYVE